MACEAIELKDGRAVLQCNTTDWFFGPTFEDCDEANAFITYCLRKGTDPRRYRDDELTNEIASWKERVVKCREYEERVNDAWLYPGENDDEPFECEHGHEDCSDVENGDCLEEMKRELGLD